jgi:hypothetical protein
MKTGLFDMSREIKGIHTAVQMNNSDLVLPIYLKGIQSFTGSSAACVLLLIPHLLGVLAVVGDPGSAANSCVGLSARGLGAPAFPQLVRGADLNLAEMAEKKASDQSGPENQRTQEPRNPGKQ